ncbi:MAG: elongation factor G [Myxococcales bacterium]|nr:elongation factor G [Myxococcales bacterium]
MTRNHCLRNFGIVAHVDAGKTTLTERILHVTGRIRRTGDVHDGNTVTDFDPSERSHGITINAASVRCDWQGHVLQLIDTPGHIDFGLEVERSLRVLDGAVVVLDGVAGVEAQTEGVWRQCDRHGVPRLAFVNKLDRPGSDMSATLTAMRARFDVEPVAIQWPLGKERDFVGVADLIHQRRLEWRDGELTITSGLPAEALAARAALVEMGDHFGAGSDPTPEGLVAALREATLAGLVVPTLGGSAYKHRGVEPLLDAVVALLPAPKDRRVGTADGEALEADPEAPLAALCFKLEEQTFGRVAMVRIYRGTLRRGEVVLHPRTGRTFRVGRLLHVFADRHDEVQALAAGEIGAIVGMPLGTGDTLCDPSHPVALEAIAVPEPVMRVALEPRSRREQAALGAALAKLVSADPSLRLETDPETGQTVLAGLGELHLAIALERLAAHDVVVNAKPPRVAYREALGQSVEQSFTLKKQTGGPGTYAQVELRIEPAEPGVGLVFEDALRGEELPRHYLPAVRAGVEQAMQIGPIGGYPIPDARVTVLGGKAHERDSSDHAFQAAAARAFSLAAAQSEGCLLEPIMSVRIETPGDRLGEVIGDLGRRRGRVLGMDPKATTTVVRAEAPLAELFGYSGALRAATGGRGSFSLSLASYAPVPGSVAREVLKSSA